MIHTDEPPGIPGRFSCVTALASPDTGTTQSSYDDAGNRLSSTDARGVQTTYTYDALNRLTRISYPSEPSQNVVFTYDQGTNAIGRLSSITDASGSTTFAYDLYGNLIRQTQLTGGHSFVVDYAYNADNKIETITYPSGRLVDYTFDTIGNIAEVTTTRNTVSQPLDSGITYLPFGRATGWTLGNGLAVSRTYPPASE